MTTDFTIILLKSPPRSKSPFVYPSLKTAWTPNEQRKCALLLAGNKFPWPSVCCWSWIFINTIGEMIAFWNSLKWDNKNFGCVA